MAAGMVTLPPTCRPQAAPLTAAAISISPGNTILRGGGFTLTTNVVGGTALTVVPASGSGINCGSSTINAGKWETPCTVDLTAAVGQPNLVVTWVLDAVQSSTASTSVTVVSGAIQRTPANDCAGVCDMRPVMVQ